MMQAAGICVFSVTMVMVCIFVTCAQAATIKIHYENDLTCYTCPEKTDNRACNRWAPDVPCSLNHTVCKTVHRINVHTGDSIQVDKMCALPGECSLDTVGCTDTDNGDHIECVSCCSHSYCNIEVPYNLTTSLDLSLSVFSSSHSVMSVYWSVMTSVVMSLVFST